MWRYSRARVSSTQEAEDVVAETFARALEAWPLGLFAATEIPHAPNPAAEFLHFGQAALGIALLLAWFAPRRR